MSALFNHSRFYFGLKITNANKYLDFKEGLVFRVATLTIGSYTGASLASELKKKLDAVGDNTYTVTYNRDTRKFTISSTVNFSLLPFTGVTIGQGVYSMIGFSSAADRSGASTYTGDIASGSEYKTQYFIQSFKPTAHNRKAIDGIINKSSSGVIEVVKFGNERFMSGEFLFITDIPQGLGSIIRTNHTGVQDYISFIESIIDKGLVEFMVAENETSVFETFILESTEQDSKGLDYELIELYDRNLPDYYRSGVLKFRLTEV